MNEQANRKKLRLAVARIFTLQMRCDSALADFAERTGWASGSPVVPTEHDAMFGEVYKTLSQALNYSHSRVVAVPVLFISPDEAHTEMKIEILTVRRGTRTPGDSSSIDIDDIAHGVTMAQICETLAPRKKWDISDIDEATRTRVAEYA